jgi:hypothetical protein
VFDVAWLDESGTSCLLVIKLERQKMRLSCVTGDRVVSQQTMGQRCNVYYSLIVLLSALGSILYSNFTGKHEILHLFLTEMDVAVTARLRGNYWPGKCVREILYLPSRGSLLRRFGVIEHFKKQWVK